MDSGRLDHDPRFPGPTKQFDEASVVVLEPFDDRGQRIGLVGPKRVGATWT